MAHGTAPRAAAAGVPQAVLDLLQLPTLDAVTGGQRRGADCVWCGDGSLNAESAVDLGEQRHPLKGSTSITGATWFPRACRRCIRERAYPAQLAHLEMCEQCVDDVRECKTGRSLDRLVREGRR
ncbi:hypothetical protein ACIHCX_03665 [Streptomyces sp. NPDC052043]|uniref:hypothetical protein n=1 Tax=Streptomyces sp. NPDC052043 TaxID=3365684 RepID=UPI0037CE1CFA